MPAPLTASVWFLLLTQAAILPDAGFPRFVDVANETGVTLINRSGGPEKDYLLETVGNGAAFFDYDRDGDVDLLITNGSTLGDFESGGGPMLALFENQDASFVDVTGPSGLVKNGWGSGVCIADFDNDGYSDVYLTAYGPNVLYQNNGDQTFQERPDAGVGDPRWGTNCAFGDYDRDGDVDLYVANYLRFDDSVPRRGEFDRCRFMGLDVACGPLGLTGEADVLYRNDGDGTFTDVTREAGVENPGYYGFGVAFSDFDNDGWPDIYVANDSVSNLLFENRGDGTFSEIGSLSGTAAGASGRLQAGMGVAVGDYDGNGFPDIFVTNFAQDTNTLYQNLGDMIFYDATAASGIGSTSFPYIGWGTGFADLDNDGLEDIFVVNGHIYPNIDSLDVRQRYRQRKEVYRNLGGGRFEEIGLDIGGDLVREQSARGAAFGDFDNDGDIDVAVINMDGPPSLYRNDGGNRNGWITLRLEGTESNRDAIGTRVELEAGGRTQFGEIQSGSSHLSHDDMRLHFGLGMADRADRIVIRWPSGNVEEREGIEAGRFVTIREGDGIIE